MTRFIKLDAADQPLPPEAPEWVGVLDTAAGLIWMKDTLGGKDMSKAQADKAIKKLSGDWRLPTVEELFCLADRTKYRPAIDTAFFPDTKADWYWTSSPFVGVSGYSWIVYFNLGYSYALHHHDEAFVRPVRSAPAAGAGQ